MIPRPLVRTAARAVDALWSRRALRGATRVGAGVRVLGWTAVTNAGELAVGDGVVLVSTPAPVALVVEAGGSLVVGEATVIESGASIRARGRVWIGRAVRIGAGAIVDDDDAASSIEIGDGAWIGDGAILTAGRVVPAGARVTRASASSNVAPAAPSGPERSGVAAREPAAASPRGPLDAAVLARVRTVVSRIVPSAAGVHDDAGWSALKGWDSLAALRVLVALEKEFALVLPPQLLTKAPTLASVALVIAASLPAGAERGLRS